MGCKGAKRYVRICGNHHAQFVGFKLPTGAIYGRIDKTFFVSLYRTVYNGKVKIYLKVGEDGEWMRTKISVNNEIYKMILGCIAQNGEPSVGKYNMQESSYSYNPVECVEYHGKKYFAYPTEFELPDVRVRKDLRGMTPELRQGGHYDVKCMKPDKNQYSVEYEGTKMFFYEYGDARDFCKKHRLSDNLIQQEFLSADSTTEIGNEYSFWAIYKDMNRRVEWSNKYKAYV